jgi:hypothetical protein
MCFVKTNQSEGANQNQLIPVTLRAQTKSSKGKREHIY